MSNEIQHQLLITGCYRTGSEYLTQLLNNHPTVSATFYTVNFMRYCYGRYDPIEEESNWIRLIEESIEKLRMRFGHTLSLDQVTARLSMDRISYASLYEALILAQHAFPGMTHWAEKTQLVWTKIPDFLSMYPRGKVIHIVRDPRSVLASFKHYTNSEPPRYLGAVFNCLGSMQHARRFQCSYPEDRYRVCRYEDLVQQPQRELSGLFAFLNLDMPPDVLVNKDWKDARHQPWHANTSFGNPDAFSVEEAITRWNSHLEKPEVFLCELINQTEMTQFGYNLSNPSLNTIDMGKLLKAILNDTQLASFLTNWSTNNEGAECFPDDPFDPSTWEYLVAE